MADFPDIYCWIKLIDQPNGKVLSSGTVVDLYGAGSVTIRYVVANDSNKPTGDFLVVGELRKDGTKLPNPLPPTTIQLQPKQLWKHEHAVNKNEPGDYEASLLGGVGGFVAEEDERNNKAFAKFSIFKPPV